MKTIRCGREGKWETVSVRDDEVQAKLLDLISRGYIIETVHHASSQMLHNREMTLVVQKRVPVYDGVDFDRQRIACVNRLRQDGWEVSTMDDEDTSGEKPAQEVVLG